MTSDIQLVSNRRQEARGRQRQRRKSRLSKSGEWPWAGHILLPRLRGPPSSSTSPVKFRPWRFHKVSSFCSRRGLSRGRLRSGRTRPAQRRCEVVLDALDELACGRVGVADEIAARQITVNLPIELRKLHSPATSNSRSRGARSIWPRPYSTQLGAHPPGNMPCSGATRFLRCLIVRALGLEFVLVLVFKFSVQKRGAFGAKMEQFGKKFNVSL